MSPCIPIDRARASLRSLSALSALAIVGCSAVAKLGSAAIALSSGSLSFVATPGGSNPATQVVTIGNSDGGALATPTATVSYADGSGWLSTTVTGASAPFTLSVQPSTGGLATGTYRATVSIASAGASNTPQSVAVTLTVAPVSPPGTPMLVQNVSSSTNPPGIGIDGNNFKFTLPNPVLPGNALVLKVAYLASASFAATPVTDDRGNSWPTTPSASRAGTNVKLAIFVLPDAAPGLTTITIHFTGSLHPVQYDCSEWAHIAVSAPVNGSAGASNLSASGTLSAGSFTPGNNDASGGNLILHYVWDDSGAPSGHVVTGFTAVPPFTLLDADITWMSDTNAFHASQYYVQAAAAPINPGMTATMTGGNDNFVVLAIALRAAAAGTEPGPGIRIVKIHHFTNETPGPSLAMQFPTTGSNMVVFSTVNQPITAVTDTAGNTYAKHQQASYASIWVAEGAATDSTLKVTATYGGHSGLSMRMVEIAGAATSSAVDASTGMTARDCSNATSIQHAPDITPGSANGLTIAIMGIGAGPGLAVTSPSGAIWDLVTYSGETDLDTMENADAMGHLYNPDASPENWTWSITPIGNNSCDAQAVHIRGQ